MQSQADPAVAAARYRMGPHSQVQHVAATAAPARTKSQLLQRLPWVALALTLALLLWHFGSGHVSSSDGAGPLQQLRLVRKPTPVAEEDEALADDEVPAEEEDAQEETWPLSRAFAAAGRCGSGTWQREYRQMHAAMLRGDMEPHYLLALGINGLADSLLGAVTLFYVAVLQRRAFFMQFGDGGRYEWAFSSPNVNWTWDESLWDEETSWNFRMHSKEMDLPQAVHIRGGDVRTLGDNYTTIAVASNKGYTWNLLDNPHHKEELFHMGLHPGNIFACAIDFLLRPRPETLEPHANQLAALQERGTLSIGVHIRVGDGQLVKGREHPGLGFFAAFFNCAAQIEEGRRRGPEQRVVYYLISDSHQLRQEAAEAYGDKVVTSLDLPLTHSRVHRGVEQDSVVPAFRGAAAEMWLLSLTDYQIVGQHSGYGRVGAFASGKWHQVYGVNMAKDAKVPPKNVSCAREAYMKRWNC